MKEILEVVILAGVNDKKIEYIILDNAIKFNVANNSKNYWTNFTTIK